MRDDDKSFAATAVAAGCGVVLLNVVLWGAVIAMVALAVKWVTG